MFVLQQLNLFVYFSDYGQAEIDPANLPMGPRFIHQPSNAIFDMHSRSRTKVHFTCEAAARPLPSYVWYVMHDQRYSKVDLTDRGKTVTSGRLTIDSPSETEDNGDYQCIAENSLGLILSDYATLSFGCEIILFTCISCCFVFNSVLDLDILIVFH